MTDFNLILLTGSAFRETLIGGLQPIEAPDRLQITAVSGRKELEQAISRASGQTRLIAFCTEVIVPQSILDQCAAGAFNFHPGPPEYPGMFPSCFAIYDGVLTFGATAHRMTAKVDGGEIVAVTRFDIPSDIDRATLDGRSFDAVLSLFQNLAPDLVNPSAEFPPCGAEWSGAARTRADFDSLCQLPENVSEDEFNRRYRAVSEGPDHALTLNLHGHRFRLDNPREHHSVTRGGQVTP